MELSVEQMTNLVILARRGLATLSERISSDEAQSAWSAIKCCETLINTAVKEKQKSEKSA